MLLKEYYSVPLLYIFPPPPRKSYSRGFPRFLFPNKRYAKTLHLNRFNSKRMTATIIWNTVFVFFKVFDVAIPLIPVQLFITNTMSFFCVAFFFLPLCHRFSLLFFIRQYARERTRPGSCPFFRWFYQLSSLGWGRSQSAFPPPRIFECNFQNFDVLSQSQHLPHFFLQPFNMIKMINWIPKFVKPSATFLWKAKKCPYFSDAFFTQNIPVHLFCIYIKEQINAAWKNS